MKMAKARLMIVVVGIVLPYVARVPGGIEWVRQYTDGDLESWLLLGGFNAIAWGALLALSFLYRRPASLISPCMLGFGFLAWAHFSIDLLSDAQAAIAIAFIPIYALVPIAIGGAVGFVLDRR